MPLHIHKSLPMIHFKTAAFFHLRLLWGKSSFNVTRLTQRARSLSELLCYDFQEVNGHVLKQKVNKRLAAYQAPFGGQQKTV